MDYLIVALGNPGTEYSKTRHNVAWMLLETLSFFDRLGWKKKFKAEYCEYKTAEEKFFFLRPLTYMNLSGQSVQELMTFYKIELKNILVVHDEVDLEFGTIAFKSGGGLAGHNGLKSIAELTGSKEFKRLRIGIGRPQSGEMSSYVLSQFSSGERAELNTYLEFCSKALTDYMQDGFEKASTNYSRKNFKQARE